MVFDREAESNVLSERSESKGSQSNVLSEQSESKGSQSNVLSEQSESKGNQMFCVYILRTVNNQLYIGHTNNLDRREIEHKRFRHGAKFTKDNFCKFKIVYQESFPSRELAMKREKQLKGWTRAKKEVLIKGNLELLKKL